MTKKKMFGIIGFCIGVFALLAPLSIGIAQIYSEVVRLEKTHDQFTLQAQQDLLDLVIKQSKLRAKEFEDSFQEYQRIHKPNWFKKREGGYVFHSIEGGKDTVYYPKKMNPEASKWVIDNVLTWDNDQVWLYFFTAPYITTQDLERGTAFNFREHPLRISSDIGREVGYTVVVEIKNSYGMTLPIRVMFGAQEYEFTQPFSETYKDYQGFVKILTKNKVKIVILPLVGLLLIIILIITIVVLYNQKQEDCMKASETHHFRRLDDISVIEERLKNLT